jgi:hypothetical protein
MRTFVASRVRDARVTDVGPITALLEERGYGGLAVAQVADLLRSLVYQPNATVLVSMDGRRTVGIALLALRPSAREGGSVGTIDLFCVDPDQGPEVAGELLGEILRSARNKGCVIVEAQAVDDPSGLTGLAAHGFSLGEPRTVWTSAPRQQTLADPGGAPRRR